ncbi:hypothetical protein Ae201684P_019494 [Aphanomyces euteiches]|uniref:Uncharacterized protein n=1 Tax=Aphanomyces euteiches TaxID=100861 RepID=A0A6G0WIX7_9STRA|nr:hypothetical protein Ae201684_014705 [Aphanomyces euteiches]KAH9078405.1 hypothetical protein Ae201684P_019494 [Aphanomyces euteiches]KAH9153111.1 hypothetical protein AeRB84_004580 [Aphanomyces euteiches]
MDRLAQCAQDFRTPSIALSTTSLVLSLAAVVYRIWKKRQQPFPDNLLTISCVFGAITSIAMMINTIKDPSSPPNVKACRVQGLLFQAALSTVVWHWILHTTVLYLRITHKMSAVSLTMYRSMYYSLLFVVPSIVMSVNLTRNHYGNMGSFCWYDNGTNRFAFFYGQLILGFVVFIGLFPSILKSRSDDAAHFPDIVSIFYLALMSLVLLFHGITGLLPESSSFLLSTEYGMCALHRLVLSSLGTFHGLFALCLPDRIAPRPLKPRKPVRGASAHMEEDDSVQMSSHSPSRVTSATQRSYCHSRATLKSNQTQFNRPPSAKLPSVLSTPSSASSQPAVEEKQDDYRLSEEMKYFKTEDFCKSSYESACHTAVSIPPDELRRLQHQEMSEAATRMLLGYVREQLQDDGYDLSSRYMSTFLSTLERTFLTNGGGGNNSIHRSGVFDTIKLNQMLKEYRRENTSEDANDAGMEQVLAKAVERCQRENLPSLVSATAPFELKSAKPKPTPSFASSLKKEDDLDAQLAAAKEQYLRGSNLSSDYSESMYTESEISAAASGTLDDQLAAAQKRYIKKSYAATTHSLHFDEVQKDSLHLEDLLSLFDDIEQKKQRTYEYVTQASPDDTPSSGIEVADEVDSIAVKKWPPDKTTIDLRINEDPSVETMTDVLDMLNWCQDLVLEDEIDKAPAVVDVLENVFDDTNGSFASTELEANAVDDLSEYFDSLEQTAVDDSDALVVDTFACMFEMLEEKPPTKKTTSAPAMVSSPSSTINVRVPQLHVDSRIPQLSYVPPTRVSSNIATSFICGPPIVSISKPSTRQARQFENKKVRQQVAAKRRRIGGRFAPLETRFVPLSAFQGGGSGGTGGA